MNPSVYIPNSEAERGEMLAAIGVASAAELFNDIPSDVRSPDLRLPAPRSEMELMAELRELAGQNTDLERYACFLGAGAYNHYIPAAVKHLTSRGEFATCYTPYQAEISQGTLQSLYEFQSLVCLLTGMDVANTGMYDGASALAEAALMACRLTGRRRVAVLASVNPAYRQVLETYAVPQGVEIEVVRGIDAGAEYACAVVQHPNYFGYLEDLRGLADAVHVGGGLLVASVDPISLGMLCSPGDCGADIAVAEGQPLGSAVSFGGPYVGILACRERFTRQLPGRLVGRTTDTKGRTGYVLTLQTREQHIRRERATSNICTSQSLVAIAAAIYLAVLGKSGLRQVAELCYHKAHYAAGRIEALPGYTLPFAGEFFKEFVVRCPAPPRRINAVLLERGIIGGLDVSEQVPNGMLLCVTETNSRRQIDALVEGLAEFAVRG